MPYVKPRLRDILDEGGQPQSTGELNYLFTKLIQWYLDGHVNYDKINAVVGALDCAKMEFYRRVAVPYEEKKREENGDVY